MIKYKKLILSAFGSIFILTGMSYGTVRLESFVPQKDLPEGWAFLQTPQIYSRKTLFNHIDGQAELFLQYGYQGSVFAVYQRDKNSKNQIEVDVYDMGDVLKAFGVFSRFRNEDKPGGFGLDSFIDDHSALFYQGRYFVMFYATESNPETLKQFAKLISSNILDPSPPPREIDYFPRSGLKRGSIQYFPEGLLGYEFLKSGFQASYTEDKAEAGVKVKVEAKDKIIINNKSVAEIRESKLFLAVLKDGHEAANALRVYKETLSKKGKVDSDSVLRPGTMSQFPSLRGEDPYQGKVILIQKGFYLLGIVGFDKEEEGENRLTEFMKNIK